MILHFPGAKTKLLPRLRPYLDKLVDGQDSFHDAFIGSGAVLLCGITVGENALIGAGSVVTRDVPPDTVVAGNPARVVKSLAPAG